MAVYEDDPTKLDPSFATASIIGLDYFSVNFAFHGAVLACV